MLKSTVVQDTQAKYELYLVNETPIDYLLHCNKFETQRAKFMKNISHVIRKKVFVLSEHRGVIGRT